MFDNFRIIMLGSPRDVLALRRQSIARKSTSSPSSISTMIIDIQRTIKQGIQIDLNQCLQRLLHNAEDLEAEFEMMSMSLNDARRQVYINIYYFNLLYVHLPLRAPAWL